MSLTPDYFISDYGYPILNREKFKLSTIQEKRQQCQQNKSIPSQSLLSSSSSSVQSLTTDNNSLKFNYCDMISDNNSRILLTKRRPHHHHHHHSHHRNTVNMKTDGNHHHNHESMTSTLITTGGTTVIGTEIPTRQNHSSNSNCINDRITSFNNNSIECTKWNWINDKEMKCFINERIKENNHQQYEDLKKQKHNKKTKNQQHQEHQQSQYFDNNVKHR